MKLLPMDAWLLPPDGSGRKLWSVDHTRLALLQLFDEDVHVARVRSLANAVAGVLNASVASIAAIGRAYARLAGIESKSGGAWMAHGAAARGVGRCAPMNS